MIAVAEEEGGYIAHPFYYINFCYLCEWIAEIDPSVKGEVEPLSTLLLDKIKARNHERD